MFNIMPSFRGNGLGNMLLQKALDQFKEQDLDNVVLQTQRNNPAAINMYGKFGFELQGIIDKYYNYKLDAVELKKSLYTDLPKYLKTEVRN